MLSDPRKELLTALKNELDYAKEELDLNKLSPKQDIETLKAKLTSIYSYLEQQGFAEDTGVDAALRPAYVIMQGLIERAQASALEWGHLKSSKAYIVTPRMPTPLMLSTGAILKDIDLSSPQAFALYRHNSMNEFLTQQGIVYAVYSHNAKTALVNQEVGLANYAGHLSQYENLKDCPLIKIDMDKFPAYITGAMYNIDGLPVTVESRQVTQIDQINASTWAIRIGQPANTRVAEIERFFEENGIAGLGK